jgi:hypothetical protein
MRKGRDIARPLFATNLESVMVHRVGLLGLVLVLLATPSCAPLGGAMDERGAAEGVLAIDFVRTFPGEQEDYLRFIEWNWARARAAAQEEGFVVGYEVIAREPDEAEWDVMLITAYADEAAYADREEHFARLFERPELAMRPVDGKGPRDMAELVGSGVEARRVLVSEPSR